MGLFENKDRFKDECTEMIYKPILGRLALPEKQEDIDYLHSTYREILTEALAKILSFNKAKEAEQDMISVAKFREWLDHNLSDGRFFLKSTLRLEEFYHTILLDTALKGKDLSDFGFLWIEDLEGAAYCSILLREKAKQQPHLLSNLEPDVRYEMLRDLAEQWHRVLFNIIMGDLTPTDQAYLNRDDISGGDQVEFLQRKMDIDKKNIHSKQIFRKRYLER